MANYVASRSVHGTLSANIADKVSFSASYQAVTVVNRGASPLFVTTDGCKPTVGGNETLVVPAGSFAALPVMAPVSSTVVTPGVTTVQLVASESCPYSVMVGSLSIAPIAGGQATASPGVNTAQVQSLIDAELIGN